MNVFDMAVSVAISLGCAGIALGGAVLALTYARERWTKTRAVVERRKAVQGSCMRILPPGPVDWEEQRWA